MPRLGGAGAAPDLGGGAGGLAGFLDHLGPAFGRWWADLADWRAPDPVQRDALVATVQAAYGGREGDLAAQRDRGLAALVAAQIGQRAQS